MKCKTAAHLLPLMVDNRLDEPLRSRVQAHLDDCAACQAELADLRRAVEFLHGAPKLEPSRDFRNAIMAAAGPELARRSTRATKRLRRPMPVWDRPAVRWALAPVAAMFVLVGTWMYVLAPQTGPMIAEDPSADTTAIASMGDTGTADSVSNAIMDAIAKTDTGKTAIEALEAVVEPRRRQPMPTRARRDAMAMMPTPPALTAPAATAALAAEPSPGATGRVRPRLTEVGPVGHAPGVLIAAEPKSTHARPYRARTGEEVASGLAGGLIANEVLLSDVIAEIAAESAINTLTPRGPSYKDLPRLAFAPPKPERGGPSYEDVPRLVFPSASSPGADDPGAATDNTSTSAPSAATPAPLA